MTSKKLSEEASSSELTSVQLMTSSCIGAILTSVFMTPFDVVKVRLQAQQRALLSNECFLYCNGLMDHICSCTVSATGQPWYKPLNAHLNGTFDAFIKITRSEGVQSLWSGLPPTLVVAVPNTIIYFTTYDKLRTALASRYGTPESPPVWAVGVAGSVARSWSVTVVSPFELIRTKLQSQSISYRTILSVMRKEMAESGIMSLWRGWVPTVLRDVPFSVFYWMCYENLKKVMNQPYPKPSFSLAAGAFSGGVAATLTLPLDVVKTHRQIEIGKKTRSGSTWEILIRIYKTQGVPGLFSGLVPRLAKVMPACAIMISSYEYAKTYFRRHG